MSFSYDGGVDQAALNKVVEYIRSEWGQSLLATDIWSIAGKTSLASYNGQPAAVATFDALTDGLVKSLADSKFPPLGKYYMIDLAPNFLVIMVPMKQYRWGMMLSTETLKMGMVFMVLNRAIEQLKKVRGVE